MPIYVYSIHKYLWMSINSQMHIIWFIHYSYKKSSDTQRNPPTCCTNFATIVLKKFSTGWRRSSVRPSPEKESHRSKTLIITIMLKIMRTLLQHNSFCKTLCPTFIYYQLYRHSATRHSWTRHSVKYSILEYMSY